MAKPLAHPILPAAVPSASERMFERRRPDKRPGDATTSRGMAPKVELRRITTIPAFACPDDRGCDGARIGGGARGAGGTGPGDGPDAVRDERRVAPLGV